MPASDAAPLLAITAVAVSVLVVVLVPNVNDDVPYGHLCGSEDFQLRGSPHPRPVVRTRRD